MILRLEDISESIKLCRRFEKDSTGRSINRTSKIGVGPVIFVLLSDGKREISTDLYIGVPFERVQMDVLGLFLTTFSRNRYLLVVVDYFTK